jgi:hypothetical protein
VNTKKHNSMCQEAKLYYYDGLCQESCGLIPQSISSHIEQCPHCQKEINQLKVVLSQKDSIKSEQGQDSSAVTTMLQLHFAYIGKYVTCETVRPFLPGMLDPAIEIRIPTPITAHLDNCSQCAEDLKAIQKLNLKSTQLFGLSQFFAKGPSLNTRDFAEMASVSAMAKRADSEVVTIYHVDESAKTRQAGESDDLYAGFPISVEVIKQKADDEQPAPTINFVAALKEKISAMNLKPFLKIGLPAAAVILVGFALLLNTPSAKAIKIPQMYKAINTIKNVHISSFHVGNSKPTKEIWKSQSQNIYMTRTPSKKVWVLWDINKKQRKILTFDTTIIETNQLSEDHLLAIKNIMSGSLGLMPFNEIAEFPQGSQLNRVEDEIPGVAEGIEIYDLMWSAPTYSSSILKKWRFFVDSKTNLPQRIEISRKSTNDNDDEYQMTSTIEIKYLRDSEIQKAIKDAGFAEF